VALTPVVELGVDEAYLLLTERFGVVDLPPLERLTLALHTMRAI
jgi:hypothetical protein